MAERIIDRFCRVPWSWDVTKQELMEIDGIGEIRAKKMIEALEEKS